jgi:hypothetical protein
LGVVLGTLCADQALSGNKYLVKSAEVQAVKEHAPGVVRSPHDPDAQWSAKGQGKEKKSWVGYKVQMAGSLPKGRLSEA